MENTNNDAIKSIIKSTNDLKGDIGKLNTELEKLLEKQKKMEESGKTSGKVYQTLASQIRITKDALSQTEKQIDANTTALKASNGSLQQNQALLESLTAQYDKVSKAKGNDAKEAKTLRGLMDDLSTTIKDQEAKLTKTTEAFDFHKASLEQLHSSFDKIKEKAPGLSVVAQGFNAMRDGLKVVQTGFTGVGAAIKATGFGLLVLVLQSVTTWLTKTKTGQHVLNGALAAVSKIVEKVQGVFIALGQKIYDVFMSPEKTIKQVWNNIVTTLTNQLKPFKTILEGLFHLDFKKVGQGFDQLGHNITTAYKNAKDSIVGFGKEIITSFKEGFKKPLNVSNGSSKGLHPAKKNISRTSDLPQAKSAGPTEDTSNKREVKNINLGPTYEDKKDDVEGDIAKDQLDKNWKKEFDDKQRLLTLEYQQAITAANLKASTRFKIEQDYKLKSAQLDKDRLAAEAANQKKYLDGVSNVSSKLMGLFGKNTVAAKAAFKAHQAAAAAQVIVDTRTAIMGIWKANAGFPLIGTAKAIAETAIVAATGASNLATILKQKPGFAMGGQYLSDGRGALLSGYSRTDNTNAYLRSGEAVVVSEAMRNPWARNLVSAVNVAFGGRDFSVTNPGRGYAIGGIFTDGGNANRYYSQPVNDIKDMANTLAYQMINNFPPIYVDVKDVNNQQNILAQTVNRVNL